LSDKCAVSLENEAKGFAAAPNGALGGDLVAVGLGRMGVHLLARRFEDAVAENGAIDLVGFHEDDFLAMGAFKQDGIGSFVFGCGGGGRVQMIRSHKNTIVFVLCYGVYYIII